MEDWLEPYILYLNGLKINICRAAPFTFRKSRFGKKPTGSTSISDRYSGNKSGYIKISLKISF